MQEKPELAASVRKKLGEIRQCWAELESTTQAKARQLFEASKADQLVQSFAELDKKLLHMESQLQDVDPGGDLATVNSQLKKLQVWPGWPRWGLSFCATVGPEPGLDFARGISDRGDLRQGLLSNVLEELETEREDGGNPASSKCWKQLEPLGRGVQRGEKGVRAKKQ